MPFYDHICHNCGYEVEIYRSMEDESSVMCPVCGNLTVQKYSFNINTYQVKRAVAHVNGKEIWER